MSRASLKHPPLRRGVASLLGASLLAGFATIAAVAVPATASSAVRLSSAPTATISVEVQDQGKNLDNYYMAQAAAFNKANPGDHVNMNVVPTNNVYKQKLLLELQGNNPPALFQTWGGGIFQQYITAKGGPTLRRCRPERCRPPRLGIRFPVIDSRQLHLRRGPVLHAVHGHAACLLLL